MPSTLLVRAVFGMLVVATAAAFVVTQRLKRSTPFITNVRLESHFSPNGDGRIDRAPIEFNLPDADEVTVSIADEGDEEVRRLADDRALRDGGHSFAWDGRTDEGRVAPDGSYRLRLTLRSEGRSVLAPGTIELDTVPPRPAVVAATPGTLDPRRPPRGGVRVVYRGRTGNPAEITVYRTGGRARPVEVDRFPTARTGRTGEWDARVRGRPAPTGIYAFTATVQDRAGNRGTGPAVPPTAEAARPGSGVSSAHLSVAGPLEPVASGHIARFRVGPRPRAVRWTLTRLGSGRRVRAGRGGGRAFGVRIPRTTRTGLHLLHVVAGRDRAVVPIAVRGRPAVGRRRGRVLVVLPAIAWQGQNRVDDDRDGFADTLDDSTSVALDRPFAGGRLPSALRREAAPMMRFLDEQRLPYDLTTDLALVRGRGPGLTGRPGVLFTGSERWLTEGIDVRLRDYVEAGGRVASFGTDAFRRRVTVTSNRLIEPSTPEPTNVFGERTSPLRIAAAPMVVTADRLALFRGTGGFIGLFTEFEQSQGLVGGARVLAGAGREARRPAFIAYRLRRGLVVRVGAPGWNRAAADPEIARVNRRVWTLLSR